eukprot:g17326.t1
MTPCWPSPPLCSAAKRSHHLRVELVVHANVWPVLVQTILLHGAGDHLRSDLPLPGPTRTPPRFFRRRGNSKG